MFFCSLALKKKKILQLDNCLNSTDQGTQALSLEQMQATTSWPRGWGVDGGNFYDPVDGGRNPKHPTTLRDGHKTQRK